MNQLTESELQTFDAEHHGSLCDMVQCKVLHNQVRHRYKDKMNAHVAGSTSEHHVLIFF